MHIFYITWVFVNNNTIKAFFSQARGSRPDMEPNGNIRKPKSGSSSKVYKGFIFEVVMFYFYESSCFHVYLTNPVWQHPYHTKNVAASIPYKKCGSILVMGISKHPITLLIIFNM
jgi:hypothetical protein